MRDPEELARMKQFDFYMKMSERFAKMADEYSPARYVENPLPIHGITAVITVHGSTSYEVHQELQNIAHGYIDRLDADGNPMAREIHGGTYSLFMEPIYPEQTPEKYATELEVWFENRRRDRGARS